MKYIFREIPDRSRKSLIYTTTGAILSGLLVVCLSAAYAAGDVVRDAVSRMKSGDPSGLATSVFKGDSEAPARFLDASSEISTERFRFRTVVFAVELEKRSRKDGLKERTAREKTAEALVRVLENDPSESVREVAAKGLRDQYNSITLARYEQRIRSVVERYPEREIALLYGELPGIGRRDISPVVARLTTNSDIDELIKLALLARHGDRDAEKKLLAKAAGLHETSLTMLEWLVDSLAYVPTISMKGFLCEGLTSEETVELTGGGGIPKRNCFAGALVRMMRDEPSFPVRTEDLTYSASEIERIDSWMSKHLGRKVRGKGKELPVIPRMVPEPR
jgi:hypothetical protein